MNLRDLKYLVALIDHHHFGRAAQACFITQPALSMQIKKLESTLGVCLLERSSKSFILTSIGKEIAERARKLLMQADEIKQIAKLAHDPLQGEIKLGIFPTLAPYFLPLVIPALSKLLPKISIFLIEEKTNLLSQKLANGSLDAAILAMPALDSSFVVHPLFTENFLLAVPTRHALAKKKLLQQVDLQNINLFLLEEGHCLREQALTFCKRLNLGQGEHFRATSLETLRHMIISGLGLTLMPQLACHLHRKISYIPFASPPARQIGLMWRATSPYAAIYDVLASHIKTLMSHHPVTIM
ncbi:MAG: LysR family transcriptional regulator [Gammaproteobacteria bacterium]|nr:LysR family transcriptional regulator [Gammaproteobacteria bacterium]